MSLKIVSSLAAVVALAACESCCDEDRSGMHDWPNPNAAADGPVPGTADHFKHSTKDRVFFGLNKHQVTADQQASVDGQAKWFAEYPSTNAMVEGHCDERGTTEYNLALGERRANAVKKSLMAKGVSGDRLQTVSYGKERPEVMGHDESAWSQNRRAVTVVR